MSEQTRLEIILWLADRGYAVIEDKSTDTRDTDLLEMLWQEMNLESTQ